MTNLQTSQLDATSQVVAEIESRQDDVLRRLDELNLLLERTIAEWMGPKRVVHPPAAKE